MTNTSSPRTFSWISTNTSMSAKRRIEARVSGSFSVAATASASGRLLLQATIFMLFGRQTGSSDRLYTGFAAFYQRLVPLSMNRLARLAPGLAVEHVVHTARGLGRHHHGDVRPVVVERAHRDLVELDHLAALVAAGRFHRPLDLHPLLAAGDRHHPHVALYNEVGTHRIVLHHRSQ